MRLCWGVLLCLVGCGALAPPGVDAGLPDDAGSAADAGPPTDAGSDAGAGDGGFTGNVVVTPMFTGRSRLGARSAAGFRPWRGGLAVVGDAVTWVESGTSPGLYRASAAGCDGGACVQQVAALVRPSAFAAWPDGVLVADVTVLKAYFADGGTQPVATASAEFVTLATDGTAAYWTTQSAPVQKTSFGGATSTLINSNGTPYALALAGARVYWAGVDISGLLGALQSVGTGGASPREESRFSGGFETLGGNGTYLYYAKGAPAEVLRVTLSSGQLEQVATNCQGVADFALDGTHAYWVEPGSGPTYANGRLRRVSHESTVPETVAEAMLHPVALALQGRVAWVAAAGSSPAWADGAILKVTLPP